MIYPNGIPSRLRFAVIEDHFPRQLRVLFLLEGQVEMVGKFTDEVVLHVDIKEIGNIVVLLIDLVFVLTRLLVEF
jgi:hypothetical protein